MCEIAIYKKELRRFDALKTVLAWRRSSAAAIRTGYRTAQLRLRRAPPRYAISPGRRSRLRPAAGRPPPQADGGSGGLSWIHRNLEVSWARAVTTLRVILPYRAFQGCCADSRDVPDDVALGNDADDPASLVEDHQRMKPCANPTGLRLPSGSPTRRLKSTCPPFRRRSPRIILDLLPSTSADRRLRQPAAGFNRILAIGRRFAAPARVPERANRRLMVSDRAVISAGFTVRARHYAFAVLIMTGGAAQRSRSRHAPPPSPSLCR